MNQSVKSLLGTSLRYHEKDIGTIYSFRFSSETGKLAGVECDNKKFYSSEHISFGDHALALLENKISEKKGDKWLRFHVVSESGKEYGEITDIEFDPNILLIRRIMVTKSVFSLPLSQYIFPYERIINVKNHTVVIDDDSRERDKEFVPAM